MSLSSSEKGGGGRFAHLPLSTSGPVDCAVEGTVLLNTPYLNKGSAHTAEEREAFNLSGLLPQRVQSLEQQARRAYEQYSGQQGDLSKNTFMTSLKDQNLVLYHRLLQDHMKEMFSIIYTPTEGEAIQNFSRIFRRPEGCFLNIKDVDRVEHDLSQWGRPEDIDYIVVSDGEEILGIGDQGAGGILISVAKLVLMTACAGLHPNRTLPVVLDCGTNNKELLEDDLYLGLRQERVRGEKYNQFVHTFVQAARKLYPRAYIHFEDFGLTNARRILEKYRPEIPCFNDDVQGTGCVTLSAIMAGLRVSGQHLKDIRMVVFGAGSAGVGIADMVRDAIAAEADIQPDEAAKQIWLVDKPGLLTTDTSDLDDAQKGYARNDAESAKDPSSLLEVVKLVKPNVLVGTSTKPGAFTEEIVRAMAEHCDRPVILPLSNPTRLHEAVPSDLLKWTNGKALVATGSPFDPVKGPWGGADGTEEVEVEVAECNNSVVFPGIGLGAVLCRAKLVTDKMLRAAVSGVSAMSPALTPLSDNDGGADRRPLLPGVEDVRAVSVRVAREVIIAAIEEGVAAEKDIPYHHHGGEGDGDGDDGKSNTNNLEDLDEWIREQMWEPAYRPLRKVEHGPGASREAKGQLKVVGSLS
ncbi:oxaloacetate-decarboxylating malate dehydrogenase [Microdochium nivale]|nr:oxaloacetate-decarboxylating malate dehydrogenase [Microdochium nivale]